MGARSERPGLSVGPISIGGVDGGSDIAHSLANEAIIAMAGPEAFARAQVYVRDGHVSGLEFDPDRRVVAGRVRGSHHASYATSVQLAGGASRQPAHRGRCSCPIAMDCKHAAAILIAARGLPTLAAQLGRPEWERSLGRLAAAGQPVREPEDVRLGLEFDLEQIPGYRGRAGPLRLRVRPVHRGRSGRWVRSGVGWEQLDFWPAATAASSATYCCSCGPRPGPRRASPIPAARGSICPRSARVCGRCSSGRRPRTSDWLPWPAPTSW